MPIVSRKSTDALVDNIIKDIQNAPTKMPLPQEKEWVSAGCPTLNLALSGNVHKGFVVGRVVNVIGDTTTGKTLLASELVNNVWYREHIKNGKKVRIRYNEPENKFDYALAQKNQMPIEDIAFVHSRTAEDFYEDITKETKNPGENDILLYIVDSLDAIGDKRAQKKTEKKGVGQQDYKVGTAAVMSTLFKDHIQDIHKANCILFIISQIRDKMNAQRWENPYTRSGGHALDFYTTHIIWLFQRQQIIHEDTGFPQGVAIKATVKKNHVAIEGRSAEFNILYGYGTDYIGSALDFALEQDIIVPKGAWYELDGNKFQGRAGLVPYLEDHPLAYNNLLDRIQEKWNQMEKDAQVVRKPKW